MNRYVVALCCLLCTAPAAAQTVTPPASSAASEGPIIDWLKKNDIAIRKTFDGKSKDESEAARISYSAPNAGDAFWLVDLGIKVKEWELCDGIGKSVLIYPILEWHKTTNAVEAADKFKFGPSIDIHVGDLTKRLVSLVVLVKGTYERDILKRLNSGNASILVGIQGANRTGGGNTWLPLSHINDRDGNLVFRYAPYAGIEYYGNLAIEKKGLPTIRAVAFTALAMHLQFDLYPLNTRGNPGWLELTVSAAQRRKVSGGDADDHNLSYIGASLNMYLDRGKHFAIGGDYESGRNPRNNFDSQNSKSVAIKIKF